MIFHRNTLIIILKITLIINLIGAAASLFIPLAGIIAGIASFMKDYPLLRQWLYGCIQKGTMPEKAYKLFRSTMDDMRQKG